MAIEDHCSHYAVVRTVGRKGRDVRCPAKARFHRPGMAVPQPGQAPSLVRRYC
jgi:hypothetical protein